MVVSKGKGKQGRINAQVQKPMQKTATAAPTGRLFPQKTGKGQQKGHKSHNIQMVKKGKGKQHKGKGKGKGKTGPKPEKRIDPSDNKGPFTQQSFIKFHGQDLGERLWEQAGALLSVDQAVSDGQIDELDLGLDNLASDNDADMGVPPPMKTHQKGGKGKGKNAVQANNPFNAFNEKEAGAKKGKGKNQTLTLKRNNSGVNQKGKKGKGKASKEPKEKRIDPSDGNGPYTYESFLKYHGDDLGNKYWNQAVTA